MKSVICVLILMLSFITESCRSVESETADSSYGSDSLLQTVIEFEKDVSNLGRIMEGEKVVAWFDYHNSGSQPLIIKNIKAGCGCTVPYWKTEPLSPGKSESIKIIFDSKGKKGVQNILVKVYSNSTVAEKELTIKAEVISSKNF